MDIIDAIIFAIITIGAMTAIVASYAINSTRPTRPY